MLFPGKKNVVNGWDYLDIIQILNAFLSDDEIFLVALK